MANAPILRPAVTALLVLVALLLPSQAAGIVFVKGVIASNHPTNLTIDRSDGLHNVLSWDAPSSVDHPLVGYWVLRTQGDGMWAPTQAAWVNSPTTTWTDMTAPFTRTTVYYVRAVMEDTDGVRTETIMGMPAIAYDPVVGPEPWACQAIEVDLAGKIPAPDEDIACTVDEWT